MANYKITSTRQVTTIDSGGNERTVTKVGITTENGSTGVVTVETKNWNDEDLPQILSDFAADLDLAFTLSGQ